MQKEIKDFKTCELVEELKRLDLVHTQEKFSLKIGGNEIPCIKEYTITASSSINVEVQIKCYLPLGSVEIGKHALASE